MSNAQTLPTLIAEGQTVLIVMPDDGVAVSWTCPTQAEIMSWMTGLRAATFYEDPAQGAK